MKLIFFLIVALTAPGQVPSFEVASVKPSHSLGEGSSIRNQPGRFLTENTSLFELIQYALPAQDFQVVSGPGWIRDARFDIVATIGQPENEAQDPAQRLAGIRARLLHLLEDRFQLQLHQEQRDVPIYELGVDKSGIRMKVADPGGNVNINRAVGGATLRGKGITMTRLTNILSGVAHRPVHDVTGLEGSWDVELKYSVDLVASDAEAKDSSTTYPALPTALQEQLGLRLTSGKGPAPVWVVVRAERPAGD